MELVFSWKPFWYPEVFSFIKYTCTFHFIVSPANGTLEWFSGFSALTISICIKFFTSEQTWMHHTTTDIVLSAKKPFFRTSLSWSCDNRSREFVIDPCKVFKLVLQSDLDLCYGSVIQQNLVVMIEWYKFVLQCSSDINLVFRVQ